MVGTWRSWVISLCRCHLGFGSLCRVELLVGAAGEVCSGELPERHMLITTCNDLHRIERIESDSEYWEETEVAEG